MKVDRRSFRHIEERSLSRKAIVPVGPARREFKPRVPVIVAKLSNQLDHKALCRSRKGSWANLMSQIEASPSTQLSVSDTRVEAPRILGVAPDGRTLAVNESWELWCRLVQYRPQSGRLKYDRKQHAVSCIGI